MIIVAPADNYEAEQSVKLSAKLNKPIYLRFGKKAMPLLAEQADDFAFGKGRVVKKGSDIAIIANGETVYPALQAAEKLQRENGINATVVSMHTIKPLDTELIVQLAETTGAILTVEEHSVNGGLGEACASFLLQNNYNKPFKIMGIPDEYTVTGSQVEIFNYYGISQDGIASAVLKLLNK
jgi:transketolase